MNILTQEYAKAGCTTVVDAARRLAENCHPVKFYYSGPNEICYLDEDVTAHFAAKRGQV